MDQSITHVESLDTIAAAFKAAPGTEILYDQEGEHGEASRRLHQLQHIQKGDSHILLIPQPSLTDVNDPLRWPVLKKWATFSNGLAYSFLGAVTGPIMAAWMVQGSLFFGVSLQELSYANGATLVCQGVATTLWMPFAIKYGRRPVYLLSTFLMGIACIWLGITSTKTFTPFVVGRAFLGIFEAPIESIVPSTITDIFFLHDRGAKVSMYGLSVLGGNEIGPMISAFIIQTLGMDWAFYIVAMFICANLVSMFFFMPETKFRGVRPSILRNTLVPTSEKTGGIHVEVSKEEAEPKKRTYVQELKFWGQSDPEVNLVRAFVRPFILLAYPTVLWSCLTYGLALSWNVIIGATTAQLFAPP
jgi:MFS family permease